MTASRPSLARISLRRIEDRPCGSNSIDFCLMENGCSFAANQPLKRDQRGMEIENPQEVEIPFSRAQISVTRPSKQRVRGDGGWAPSVMPQRCRSAGFRRQRTKRTAAGANFRKVRYSSVLACFPLGRSFQFGTPSPKPWNPDAEPMQCTAFNPTLRLPHRLRAF